ncbi:isochorismate synthase [Gordonia otitidis]|uniref:Isochorismate synthase n=1 Tax=Gordonia otitidis (strain DSM 44809 / CCUG 52243 / JCM 12355 / NBRC 100426 / IFM 10032) TaxID=1108044 RepID=H5TNF1_GORO1|nr:chorismate-binding protein [Gordonia otitidis]GAB35009.1 putative isochorismate synthase [Gordonia otitidis NBRC 100426]
MSLSTPSVTRGHADNGDTRRVDKASTTHFDLAGTSHHVIASGTLASFDDPARAAEALARGTYTAVVGALAFDTDSPSALTAPVCLRIDAPGVSQALESPAPRQVVRTRIRGADPSAAGHRGRVAAAVAVLADPATPLAKVVLARKLLLHSTPALTPELLASILAAQNPHSPIFRTDLTPAGGNHRDRHLVGASPEVLVRRRGNQVSAHPLAGSAPRHPDPAVDAERARALGASIKDLGEHHYVVDALRNALAPLCNHLEVPERPSVVSTASMWHLGTPIIGRLADESTTALDLALAVHPTPAVCGTPTKAARDYILTTEGDRGFYGGAVGWCVGDVSAGVRSGALSGPADGTAPVGVTAGDGEWLVAIRCAEIDSRTGDATTWAGGGIVAGSDPDDELAETTAKFRTVLRALGVEDA